MKKNKNKNLLIIILTIFALISNFYWYVDKQEMILQSSENEQIIENLEKKLKVETRRKKNLIEERIVLKSKIERYQDIIYKTNMGFPIVENYVGSIKSNKYHLLNCEWTSEIYDHNIIYFSSRTDAENNGYIPCKVCNP